MFVCAEVHKHVCVRERGAGRNHRGKWVYQFKNIYTCGINAQIKSNWDLDKTTSSDSLNFWNPMHVYYEKVDPASTPSGISQPQYEKPPYKKKNLV